MHIGVFGLAGAGKTTLTHLLEARNPSYKAVSASKLIAMDGGAIKYELLDHEKVHLNQSVLVSAYASFKAQNECTLIELHCLIETPQGVDEVDPTVLQALGLDAVFFLLVQPAEILRRREMDAEKMRRAISVSELCDLQNRSLDILNLAFPGRVVLITPESSLRVVEEIIAQGNS